MKEHLNIYGAKSFAAVNAICGFMRQYMLLFSEESESRVVNPVGHTNVGIPVLELDNEVCLMTNLTNGEAKDSLTYHVKMMLGKIKPFFRPDEKLYLANLADSKKSNKELLAHVQLKKYESIFDIIWPHGKALPLTIEDFMTVYRELQHPTREGQEVDPFLIMKRAIEARELYRLASKLGLSRTFLISWLLFDEVTIENFQYIAADLKDGEQMIIDALKKPEFNEFLNLINKMREDGDWLDPFILFRDDDFYDGFYM